MALNYFQKLMILLAITISPTNVIIFFNIEIKCNIFNILILHINVICLHSKYL